MVAREGAQRASARRRLHRDLGDERAAKTNPDAVGQPAWLAPAARRWHWNVLSTSAALRTAACPS